MARDLQLIAGIDPGTTTGIALLNLRGELVSLKSGKNLSRSKLSKIISGFGNPLIVASDTKPVPRAIGKIATIFSARLLSPGQRFSRKEKHEIARSYLRNHGRVWSNMHERDALVAALYAWKKIEPVVRRIGARLRKRGVASRDMESFVEKRVLLQRKSIDSSIKKFLSGRKRL